MSTIVEVAKRAGVSTATVSNVIRGTRRVSEARKERVQAAIRDLNYSPNEIARSLKVRQTRMIAMVLPDITNPFFPEMIRGAEDAAFARGYFLLTANTDEQTGRERRIITALRSYRVDGILLATTQGLQEDDTSHIASVVQGGVSVVCLDRAVPDVPTDAVLLDNVGGARAERAAPHQAGPQANRRHYRTIASANRFGTPSRVQIGPGGQWHPGRSQADFAGEIFASNQATFAQNDYCSRRSGRPHYLSATA